MQYMLDCTTISVTHLENVHVHGGMQYKFQVLEVLQQYIKRGIQQCDCNLNNVILCTVYTT
jgi:hypothetical protein